METRDEIANLRMRVSQLEGMVASLYSQLKLTYVPDVDVLNQPVIELLKQGRYMEAIARYRDIHKTSLGDGKAAVDQLKSRHNL